MLMSEPDHIWLRPMPNLMKGRRPAAFPFFYIGDSSETTLVLSCILSLNMPASSNRMRRQPHQNPSRLRGS